MYTRRQPKNVIIHSRDHSNNNLINPQHRRYFSEIETESKIKSIMVKIIQDLKRRNKNIFNNQLISDTNLKENLFYLLKEEDLTRFDYEKFLSKAEQECIIDHLKSKSSKNNNKTFNEIRNNNNEINEKNVTNLSHFLPNKTKENNINNISNLNININNSNKDPLTNMLSPLNVTNNTNKNISSNTMNTNNFSLINPLTGKNPMMHSSLKYEELKNIKEKDEWGILTKKKHEEYVNEKINKLQAQAERKKEFTHFLANQIVEKNNQKQVKINNDQNFHDNLIKEIENSKKSEIMEREKNENKIREFMEQRDKVFNSKK